MFQCFVMGNPELLLMQNWMKKFFLHCVKKCVLCWCRLYTVMC
jgi:hypothetical protein